MKLTGPFCAALLLATSVKLTLLVLAGVPLVVAPIILFGRRVRHLARASQDLAERARSKKLSIKKESIRDRASAEPRTPRGAIVINTKALRGMVIERSAASLFKRGG